MANKYTRMIDDIFNRWDPEKKTKYIYLGYCHEGDEDGGCDEYDHICDGYWEIEGQYPHKMEDEICFFNLTPPNNRNEAEKQRDEYVVQYDNLCDELKQAFGGALEPNYTSTNCYWYRYYFVTRNYEIVTLVSRGDIDGNWQTEARIALLSEDEAEDAADKQLLDKINENCSDIASYLRDIKSDKNKEKAYNKIKNLIKG